MRSRLSSCTETAVIVSVRSGPQKGDGGKKARVRQVVHLVTVTPAILWAGVSLFLTTCGNTVSSFRPTQDAGAP